MTSGGSLLVHALRSAPAKTLEDHFASLSSENRLVRCTALAATLEALEKKRDCPFDAVRAHMPTVVAIASNAVTPQELARAWNLLAYCVDAFPDFSTTGGCDNISDAVMNSFLSPLAGAMSKFATQHVLDVLVAKQPELFSDILSDKKKMASLVDCAPCAVGAVALHVRGGVVLAGDALPRIVTEAGAALATELVYTMLCEPAVKERVRELAELLVRNVWARSDLLSRIAWHDADVAHTIAYMHCAAVYAAVRHAQRAGTGDQDKQLSLLHLLFALCDVACMYSPDVTREVAMWALSETTTPDVRMRGCSFVAMCARASAACARAASGACCRPAYDTPEAAEAMASVLSHLKRLEH